MLCFVFSLLVILLDQFIKRWVLLTLELHESKGLVPGVIGLTRVENTGAAFSILAGQRWLLIGIALVASLLLIAILLRYNDGFWGTLGLAAVLGGTVGNLVDRISYGHVIDILEFKFMNFAIFNIADIFITLGGLTFLIYFIISSIKPAETDESIYEGVVDEYSHDDHQNDEDRIGLYDFQYDEEERGGVVSEYEYTFDAGNYSNAPVNQTSEVTAGAAETEPRTYAAAYAQSDTFTQANTYPQADAYDQAESFTYDNSEVSDIMQSLDALSELEKELGDTGMFDDYDIDALLREYGFEDE